MSSDLKDVRDVPDPLNKVTAGLIGKGKKSIPLKSVHIRSHLLDLVAKVFISIVLPCYSWFDWKGEEVSTVEVCSYQITFSRFSS